MTPPAESPSARRTATRSACVVWRGGLMQGSGEVTLPSRGGERERISWPSRTAFESEDTSPEELIAAAHAGCFSMALSQALERYGTPPTRLAVRATCRLDLPDGGASGEEGSVITGVDLRVRACVPGLSEGDFSEATATAEAICPVSNALRATLAIHVDAMLEQD